MNILITGGAGFIGSSLCLKLLAQGYKVTVVDNLSPQIHGQNPSEDSPLFKSILNKITFIHGTVTSRKDLETSITDQDVIIHLAAETGTGQSMYDIQHYVNTNIGGTSLLLDILTNKKHSIKKFIIASSRAVYGEGKYFCNELGIVYPPQRDPIELANGNFEVKIKDSKFSLQVCPTDEDSNLHPTSIYGITKRVQEEMVMTLCPTIGIAPVSFRYQNVFGPGQSLHNPYTGILSIFSNCILNHNKINIFEDGNESRDFVFIDDVVNATIAGIQNSMADGEIFNVGFGMPIKVLTVAQKLMHYLNIEVPLNITGNFRIGDIRHNFADISKLKAILNYSPYTNFDDGISQFCNWVLHQKPSLDKYDKSLREMKEKGFLK